MKPDTKVWVPTHDGNAAKLDIWVDCPFRRGVPIFRTKGAANSWCAHVGAVATATEYSKAVRAIEGYGAKPFDGA